MPKYKLNLNVKCINGETENILTFLNEELSINNSGYLWIKNVSNTESDLIETIKLHYMKDKNTNTRTYYKFEPSTSTVINNYLEYYVDSISDLNAIFFKST